MNGSLAIRTGATWMAVAVGLGAFGAHALKDRLELLGTQDTWQTAVQYQGWHALALLLLGVLTIATKQQLAPFTGRLVGWLLLTGNFLFSASLYLLAMHPTESWLGPITPLGGALMILGWIGFAVLGGALTNAERKSE